MSKKRSNGEGSVKRLKNGSWRGQIMDGYTADGKRNIVNVSASTKAEVLEKIRTHLNQKEEHIKLDKTLTLTDWGETWYSDYKSQVQPSTYAGYRYTLNIIVERLGSTVICDLLPIHINGFLDTLVTEGYSLSQIRKCRTMLIQIFNAAEDNGLVNRNPASRAKSINGKDQRLAPPKQAKDAFTEGEVAQLLTELPNDLLGNSIRTMLGTGLRVQELLALTPSDIGEDGSWISVTKAIKTVDGHPTLGGPKSPKSCRTIPVPEAYHTYVCYLRQHGGKAYIWSVPGGNPYYNVGSFRRRFYTLLRSLDGVRRLSPHCCRHTYITRLQAKGVPMETISKLAGHSALETTHVYLHQSDATLAKAVAVLNQSVL